MLTKLLAQNRNKPILPADKFVQRKKGLQKLAYDQCMTTHYNLDFIAHLKERLQTMFAPFVLNWASIHFENSIAALKPFKSSGNVMKGPPPAE